MGTFYIQFVTNIMSPGALVATSTKQERWFFLMPKSELQICVALEQKGQACKHAEPLSLAFSGPVWREGHSGLNSGPLSRLSVKRRLAGGSDSQAVGEDRSTGPFPFHAGRYSLSREIFISHSAGTCSHQDMRYTSCVSWGFPVFPFVLPFRLPLLLFFLPPQWWALPQPALPL